MLKSLFQRRPKKVSTEIKPQQQSGTLQASTIEKRPEKISPSSSAFKTTQYKRPLDEKLSKAVTQKDTITTKLLLETGGSPNLLTNDNHDTLLHIAAGNNDPDMISLLMEYKADLAIKNNSQLTPIALAGKLGHWRCVRIIAQSKKTDSSDTYDYRYALGCAILRNLIDEAEILLKKGATDVCIYSNSTYRYSLHIAVKENNPHMIKMLLKHGSNLTRINANGYTPMKLAADLNYWDCVNAIADHQRTDTSDSYQYNYALECAIKAEKMDTVEILLSKGASANWMLPNNQDSFLHIAVKKRNPKMIRLLLEYAADRERLNQEKLTPLTLATTLGHKDCVAAFSKKSILMEQKNIPNATNEHLQSGLLSFTFHLRVNDTEGSQASDEEDLQPGMPSFATSTDKMLQSIFSENKLSDERKEDKNIVRLHLKRESRPEPKNNLASVHHSQRSAGMWKEKQASLLPHASRRQKSGKTSSSRDSRSKLISEPIITHRQLRRLLSR